MHRLIAPIVFSTVMIIGAGITLTLYDGAEQARRGRANDYASQFVDRISLSLSQHFALLRATDAYFTASPTRIKRHRFAKMIEGVGLEENYPGMQGIGFAEAISSDQDAALNALLQRDYDDDVKIWPATDQSQRAVITLLAPLDARNKAAIGYDMYSEPVRRQAIQKAYETGELVASGPVQLVQEITSVKQAGFLIYIRYLSEKVRNHDTSLTDGTPVLMAQKPMRGLMYAPVRAGNLFTYALEKKKPLPIAISVHDLDDKSRPLFISPRYDDKEQYSSQVTRVIDVAGRKWVLDIRVRPSTQLSIQEMAPYAALSIFTLLAAMLAWIIHSQLRAVQTAHKLHELTQKNLSEKDLLLQEMKHRIKNSIARILAMARQTAHHSDSLEGFSESFTARLQAMANAQDALTRSHWQRADLEQLLTRELAQVLGDNQFEGMISGPKIELDESMVQAFALTFHELATNALKYSNVAQDNTALKVTWKVDGKGKERMLTLVWQERSQVPVEVPSHKGFGTKLIDANIRGELRGSIERRYGANGLLVLIKVPINNQMTRSAL